VAHEGRRGRRRRRGRAGLIPPGLAVAVAAGVAAAAALGLALSPLPRDGATVYVEGPSLSLASERPAYGAGEAVLLTLTNTGSVEIHFGGASHYGLSVSRLDGAPVYGAPAREASGPLGPREAVEIAWGQVRQDGTAAHPGTYRISSEGASADGEAARASITVDIHGRAH